jgi:hypothetical protein
VVIAVPDLRWSDLADMPHLSAYAAQSSVGNLVVRAEPPASRCVDGSLTFASGNRAHGGVTPGCTLTAAQRARLHEALLNNRYGADINAFGDALRAGHLTSAAYLPGADLLLGSGAGPVREASSLRTAMRSADVVAILDDALYDAAPNTRALDARSIDRDLASELALVPAQATTIVAGTSDGPTGGPHLHVVIFHGPGWRHVELGSPTTHGTFVQLIDLAPTILAEFGLPTPKSMIGRPAFDTGRAAPSMASFVDSDRHAVGARRVSGSLHTWFGIFGWVVLFVFVGSWILHSRGAYRVAMWLSRLALGVPIASYLLQVVPWWRHLAWYPLMLLVVTLVLAGVTTLAARRDRLSALVAVLAIITVVLGVDQLAGAPLQASSPLGNLPLTAGRFHGMGNIAFAVFCSAAIVGAAVIGASLREQGRTRAAVLAVVGIGLVVTVIDAAPRWGDDFGGILTMPLCVALLAVLVAGATITWKRAAAVLVGVALIAVAVALADYSRPTSSQTHIGRFVGDVLHGGAGRTISRKLYSADHSFGNVPVTASVVLLVVAIAVWHRQAGQILGRVVGLREAAITLGVFAVLGSTLNDSGVVVAQFALVSAFLAVVGSCAADPTLPDSASDVASGRTPLPAPGTPHVA